MELKDDSQISQTLETCAARYLSVIADSIPELTDREWCVVLDAAQAHVLTEDISPERMIEAVKEAISSENLGRKWGIDDQKLADTLSGASTAEQAGISEMVELYWKLRTSSQEDQTITQTLQRAKGILLEMEPIG